ncbi:hypothetical protein GY45DRAFT_1141482 [Cubamyces sp. BRFM 1775]|nr:hypothetical protein GY45DRAFT_1141482 [Cubamyces sp. BRFM 1775]
MDRMDALLIKFQLCCIELRRSHAQVSPMKGARGYVVCMPAGLRALPEWKSFDMPLLFVRRRLRPIQSWPQPRTRHLAHDCPWQEDVRHASEVIRDPVRPTHRRRSITTGVTELLRLCMTRHQYHVRCCVGDPNKVGTGDSIQRSSFAIWCAVCRRLRISPWIGRPSVQCHHLGRALVVPCDDAVLAVEALSSTRAVLPVTLAASRGQPRDLTQSGRVDAGADERAMG